MRRRHSWVVVVAAGVVGGCPAGNGSGETGRLEGPCGLGCPDEGLAEGNATISSVASIDAFFGAIIDVQSASATVRASIRADLDAIALSVGLPRGAAGQDIATTISDRIAADTESGLQLVFEQPVCQASVEVAARAAAECDVDVDPGEVSVACEGTCQLDAGAIAQCSGGATLQCTGGAPNFVCSGSCAGECELTAEAACDGTCRGTCNGTCSVVDAQGNCAGECVGMCLGTCELEAGGTCNGECRGTCEYEPGMAGCEAAAEAKCEAAADGSVECTGRCEGTAAPPTVKAECEAAVQAKADAALECAPPRVNARWQWSAAVAGDPVAQASFRAWVEIVSGHAASMMSKGVKGDIIINGFTGLLDASTGAFRDGVDAAAKGDLKAKIGAGCALEELDAAAIVINDETAALFDSLQAASTVLAAFD